MILLDTHAWLWLNGAVGKIPASTRAILAQPELPVFFSAASAWEIAVKFQAGRLEIPLPPDLYIPSRLEQTGIASLPSGKATRFALVRSP